MNKLNLPTSLIGCLIFSGCTVNPVTIHGNAQAQALIANDMVNLLVQTAELPVATTTLTYPLRFTEDSFATALLEKLEIAGYDVRPDGNNPGETVVSYTLASTDDPQSGPVDTYTVTIGDISARRAYITDNNQRVTPLAPMQIKGTNAAGLSLDNGLFENQMADLVKPRNNRVAEDMTKARESTLLDIVAPTTYGVAGQVSVPSALRELSNAPTKNVRELGQSNFADEFARLVIVQEIILTFGNDSVRMGPVNKSRVSELVRLYDGATDVFSVIGCSNGATSMPIGQEGLALGRAERVKEELLFAGVADENILKEGCWAGETYDERMPRRGVVLSLKRNPA